MKKMGDKKMPIPRQEIIDNPIPTSLFSINYLYTFTSVPILHPQCPHATEQLHSTNKDVGMGLSMVSCLGIGIFLSPFFFMM